MKTNLICWLAVCFLSGVVAFAQAPKDDQQIRAIIEDCEKGYNEDNADLVLQHYSKDILVSYPGRDDMDYEGFTKAYREMMSRRVKKTIRAQIDEIVISGDLAMVRLQWYTTLHTNEGDNLRKAKDLQIFRKENGKWKFYRGMWYHLTQGAPDWE
jgi:uncharacterized protein (TIGR02246 family)